MSEKLEMQIDNVKDSLRDMQADIKIVSSTLGRNTVSLEEHMARSNALEKQVNLLQGEIGPLLPEIKRLLLIAKWVGLLLVANSVGGNEKLVELLMKLAG